MDENLFWSIVKNFNSLMNSAIEGPNCIDPNKCRGDCCSIKIDVPKILIKEYIERDYATKEDFTRGDVFSFKLRFNNITGKCFLFSKDLNGCIVHNSGIKPPQCWIYPTNFSNPEKNNISCKRANGWKIIDESKTKKAEKLLQKYIFLCQLEAKKELKKINNRMGKVSSEKSIIIIRDLIKKMQNCPPARLGGFRDTWDHLELLPAEGFSLQMKKFCLKFEKDCPFLDSNFLECTYICKEVANELIKFLHNYLYHFIKRKGPDPDGLYPLYELFKFSNLFKDFP